MSPVTSTATAVRSQGRNGIALVVLTVVLLGAGVGFWTARKSQAGPSPGETGSVKSTLHLETFVINLADPGQRSYLRAGVDLGLSRTLARVENAPVGQVRDIILGVLAESRVDELLTAKGKTRLREDLLRALQQGVPGLGVEEVYFTEFLIQR